MQSKPKIANGLLQHAQLKDTMHIHYSTLDEIILELGITHKDLGHVTHKDLGHVGKHAYREA